MLYSIYELKKQVKELYLEGRNRDFALTLIYCLP